ncbi:hypothetical protein KPH14_008408 [Odynerus spinipes]|uniref:Uncharacterized protein n=1 Tax=Odynerus spinipes TaxID=1348599 RepID=A0AAD9RBA1_9HYME|nr:hypothetical protein KPH14_008408 [Odynerus spinipes]
MRSAHSPAPERVSELGSKLPTMTARSTENRLPLYRVSSYSGETVGSDERAPDPTNLSLKADSHFCPSPSRGKLDLNTLY